MAYAQLTNNTLTLQYDDTYIVEELCDQTAKRVKKILKKAVGDSPARLNQLIKNKILPLVTPVMALTLDPNHDLFVKKGSSLYLREIPHVSIPNVLANKMSGEPDTSLINFWRWACLNPDPAARDNLFWFLSTHDFEIDTSGYFVAYRNAVTVVEGERWTDKHTGTTTIRVGIPVSMPRELCDSNQEITCSTGLHVASKTWLSRNYCGDTGLAVLVNPMNVVAVPPKDSYGKMRVCEYVPMGRAIYEDKKIVAYTRFKDFVGIMDNASQKAIRQRLDSIQEGTVKEVFKHDTNLTNLLERARNVLAERIVTHI